MGGVARNEPPSCVGASIHPKHTLPEMQLGVTHGVCPDKQGLGSPGQSGRLWNGFPLDSPLAGGFLYSKTEVSPWNWSVVNVLRNTDMLSHTWVPVLEKQTHRQKGECMESVLVRNWARNWFPFLTLLILGLWVFLYSSWSPSFWSHLIPGTSITIHPPLLRLQKCIPTASSTEEVWAHRKTVGRGTSGAVPDGCHPTLWVVG